MNNSHSTQERKGTFKYHDLGMGFAQTVKSTVMWGKGWPNRYNFYSG